jgi:diaminopimelate dehydrogenase
MINIGIVGYGNVGRGVVIALSRNPDMRLAAVFTRRPDEVKKEILDIPVIDSTAPSVTASDITVDVAVLCGGSRYDTPSQGALFVRKFNTVDSFDTHADIPSYFQRMDALAKEHNHVAIISAGWDPGIFSMERVAGDAFLPEGKGHTFWGPGVSQGHSDAARKVKGVIDAREYTLPVESTVEQIRQGKTPAFSKREMHKRVVYVVAQDTREQERIRREIKEIPNYYIDYDTEVIFLSEDEMRRKHSSYPHGGFVLTSGLTGENHRQILEYRCQLDSNPEFTASVLVACARAAFRLKQDGRRGAFTMLDISPALLSPHSGDTLRSRFM